MMAMLNEMDIELMQEWQDEIYTLRERPISVIYLDKLVDPVTGVTIGESEQTREVTAVVTEFTSSNDRSMKGESSTRKAILKATLKSNMSKIIPIRLRK